MADDQRCIARAWPQHFWGEFSKAKSKHDPALDITEAPLAGPHSFDITDQILALGEKTARAIRDSHESSDALWTKWCLDHVAGSLYRLTPARVEAQTAIDAYFRKQRRNWLPRR